MPSHLMRGLITAGCLLAASGASAQAGETEDLAHFALARLPLFEGGEGHHAPLTMPMSWRSGDAAAFVLAEARAPDLARERLVGMLIADGAAVLELVAGADEAPRALAAALAILRRDWGAGLVVAIGTGPRSGAAVLDGAGRGEGGSLGYAAAAALGGGAARFAPGAWDEEWPPRAGLFCEVLARAAPGDAALREGCRATLVETASLRGPRRP